MCGPTPPFSGGFTPAFARCCFCIAISLLVFTSPTVFPLLPRIIPNLHPCQCIRVADDLWSGDMRKLHPCQGIRFADSLRSGDMRKVPRRVLQT